MTTPTDGQSPQQEMIYKRIREIGKAFPENLPEEMGRLYAPLMACAPRDRVEIIKDEKYGTDERNILDIYLPVSPQERAMPILVFIHGGGYISGDKSFCKNIGRYFAGNNIITIIPSYRLAPKHKWPSGAEDVAGVLRWLGANADRLGGDAGRIFLMGQSAGADHVATYLYFNEFHSDVVTETAGAILMSGPFYDAKEISGPCLAYFGEDKKRHASFSIINRIENSKVPLFIMFAEYDPPEFDRQSVLLFNAVYKHYGKCPFIKRIIGHNHISEVMHINTGDDSIGPDIVSFVNSTGHSL